MGIRAWPEGRNGYPGGFGIVGVVMVANGLIDRLCQGKERDAVSCFVLRLALEATTF